MDILRRVRSIESTIAGRLETAAKELVRSGPREPLEIAHAILQRIEGQIQPGSRGRAVFPFNRIGVSVVAAAAAQPRIDAIINGEAPLRDRILERLRAHRCDRPDLAVDLAYVERAGEGWPDPDFHLELSRVAAAVPVAAAPPAIPPRLKIGVRLGTAGQAEYTIEARRINLGRGAEVRDRRNRLLRTNDIAFLEEAADAINQSVSRQHAHIRCEPDSRDVRVFDDGSGHGTSIVRDGRTIDVPRGARGVRLRAGDELVLGESRLVVDVEA